MVFSEIKVLIDPSGFYWGEREIRRGDRNYRGERLGEATGGKGWTKEVGGLSGGMKARRNAQNEEDEKRKAKRQGRPVSIRKKPEGVGLI